jgi:hypothetical protein
MKRVFFALLFGLLVTNIPVSAVQPQSRPGQRGSVPQSAEQWARQLENELDHLEEDLHYERGTYPPGLAEQIDQTSRAVARFRQLLRRNEGPQRLMREFRDMDQQVHRLVHRLEESGDGWLRRQAARIRYPDEQLHYVLRRMEGNPQDANRELIARHAHLLEREARSLQDLVGRVARRDDDMRRVIGEFAEAVEHFHQTAEGGADLSHLNRDFREIDETWEQVVQRINRSAYGLYLRRNAQNVNRVHNQIYELLAAAPGPPPRVAPPQAVPPQQVAPQPPPRRPRPTIDIEIPGLGRFSIPR